MSKTINYLIAITFTLILGYFNLGNETFIDNTSHSVVVVNSGDSVWSIAKKITPNDMDIREVVNYIIEANNINSASQLQVGSKIRIPEIKNKSDIPQALAFMLK